ncbi:dienelactone hydrolase [Streptosporangium becharense]|uniref:Dienelactone hydrolase n=1 Tax=Streptosporangium becharense TaxID=1816182 RepID=A0A7W9IMB8_9ACTN|nr:prolyl oligopeptidase family serine peptidase [Streptosporangium becharense]MBB2914524.1 dienelactone hydrolase [Streptosporangium becharense]MBB5823369.1 dienelactone hydrolase [Streptosporangium becharense]
MNGWPTEPISGTAAGVPFTALPPARPPEGAAQGTAPLVVTWHMIDAPCTDAAFAAALPMAGVPAWRVHLGMPLCGRRMLDSGMNAILERARRDTVLAYLEPMVRQAVEEFPAALAALRERLPVDDGPISVVGGSLGGAVALSVLTRCEIPVAAAALVNPAIRARSVVGLVEGVTGRPYEWSEEAAEAADRLDFVARAEEIADRVPRPPLLVVSGELDFPALRADAAALVGALRERYTDPERVRLATVAGLAHPLAEQPGLEPAPQLPVAETVDETITEWFRRHLTAG